MCFLFPTCAVLFFFAAQPMQINITYHHLSTMYLFYFISGDENKATLLHLGVLEGLVPLIGHEDKYVKRYACMAFGIMSSHGM